MRQGGGDIQEGEGTRCKGEGLAGRVKGHAAHSKSPSSCLHTVQSSFHHLVHVCRRESHRLIALPSLGVVCALFVRSLGQVHCFGA